MQRFHCVEDLAQELQVCDVRTQRGCSKLLGLLPGVVTKLVKLVGVTDAGGLVLKKLQTATYNPDSLITGGLAVAVSAFSGVCVGAVFDIHVTLRKTGDACYLRQVDALVSIVVTFHVSSLCENRPSAEAGKSDE
jgi:hypothetical protein